MQDPDETTQYLGVTSAKQCGPQHHFTILWIAAFFSRTLIRHPSTQKRPVMMAQARTCCLDLVIPYRFVSQIKARSRACEGRLKIAQKPYIIWSLGPKALKHKSLPVGSYHTPFFGYLIFGLGSQNHKVEYPKKGVWYEPTGRALGLGLKLGI